MKDFEDMTLEEMKDFDNMTLEELNKIIAEEKDPDRIYLQKDDGQEISETEKKVEE